MENENIEVVDEVVDAEFEANASDDTAPEEGQVVDSDAGADAEDIESEDLFDYTQFADKTVKLQVNGEEVTVPLAEALAGYQRQADYTRKTQELSEQKKQVQFGAALVEALEKDPAGTLQLLGQQYGVNTEPETSQEEDGYFWTDPADKQIKELEKRLAVFEQERAMEHLQRTLDSLSEKYGDAFDADEVVAKAYAEGSTDLEAVFKKIAFDKVFAETQALKKKTSEEGARMEAKRKASVVSGATTAKSTTPVVSEAPKSVFEAYEQAKRAHGA